MFFQLWFSAGDDCILPFLLGVSSHIALIGLAAVDAEIHPYVLSFFSNLHFTNIMVTLDFSSSQLDSDEDAPRRLASSPSHSALREWINKLWEPVYDLLVHLVDPVSRPKTQTAVAPLPRSGMVLLESSCSSCCRTSSPISFQTRTLTWEKFYSHNDLLSAVIHALTWIRHDSLQTHSMQIFFASNLLKLVFLGRFRICDVRKTKHLRSFAEPPVGALSLW